MREGGSWSQRRDYSASPGGRDPGTIRAQYSAKVESTTPDEKKGGSSAHDPEFLSSERIRSSRTDAGSYPRSSRRPAVICSDERFTWRGSHDAVEFPPTEEPARGGMDLASPAAIDGEPATGNMLRLLTLSGRKYRAAFKQARFERLKRYNRLPGIMR